MTLRIKIPSDRPRRRRRLRGSRLEIAKRPDSADRKPAKVAIVTGLNSRAVHGELDQRFGFARAIRRYTEEYQQHVGEDQGVVMADFCRSAGTAKAIRNVALARLLEAGPLNDKDGARAAYESYRRADADLREILRYLGLERREKPVPTLEQYLAQKATQEPRQRHAEGDGRDAEDGE